jgi:hypothetical protein
MIYKVKIFLKFNFPKFGCTQLYGQIQKAEKEFVRRGLINSYGMQERENLLKWGNPMMKSEKE